MSTPTETWRLVRSDAADGATNMSLDEAVLEQVTAGLSPPTLRLYRWTPPALSLGYAQPAADVDLPGLRRLGWDLVRRPTGGRAILHADELTYAVIAPDDNPHVAGGVLASYQHLSRALLSALEILGLDVDVRSGSAVSAGDRSNPVCFEVPSAYELTASGKKIVGSAQLRRKGGVLQHGSFPLQGDITRICSALRFDGVASRAAAAARVAARAGTASDLAGRSIAWEEAADAFEHGFQQGLGINLVPDVLTAGEQDAARDMVRRRHRTEAWLLRL
jgi:lipoate-protein ligase A